MHVYNALWLLFVVLTKKARVSNRICTPFALLVIVVVVKHSIGECLTNC